VKSYEDPPPPEKTIHLGNVTDPQTINVSSPLEGKQMLKMSNKEVLETVVQMGKQV